MSVGNDDDHKISSMQYPFSTVMFIWTLGKVWQFPSLLRQLVFQDAFAHAYIYQWSLARIEAIFFFTRTLNNSFLSYKLILSLTEYSLLCPDQSGIVRETSKVSITLLDKGRNGRPRKIQVPNSADRKNQFFPRSNLDPVST